jgi:hypothetical protein
MAKTKSVAAPKPAPEPAIIIGRPHSMPRRLYNVPASRRDTSGTERTVETPVVTAPAN